MITNIPIIFIITLFLTLIFILAIMINDLYDIKIPNYIKIVFVFLFIPLWLLTLTYGYINNNFIRYGISIFFTLIFGIIYTLYLFGNNSNNSNNKNCVQNIQYTTSLDENEIFQQLMSSSGTIERILETVKGEYKYYGFIDFKTPIITYSIDKMEPGDIFNITEIKDGKIYSIKKDK